MRKEERSRRKQLIQRSTLINKNNYNIKENNAINNLCKEFNVSKSYCKKLLNKNDGSLDATRNKLIEKKSHLKTPTHKINKYPELKKIKSELKACYLSNQVHMSPHIPIPILKKAITEYATTARVNTVFAVIDISNLHNGKYGIVFTHTTIYIRNYSKVNKHFKYNDIKHISIDENCLLIKLKNKTKATIQLPHMNLKNLKNVIDGLISIDKQHLPLNNIQLKSDLGNKAARKIKRAIQFTQNAVEANDPVFNLIREVRPEHNNLQLGDHLYVKRCIGPTTLGYTHHGLYSGHGMVIHYLRDGIQYDKLNVFADGGKVLKKSNVSSPTKYEPEEIIERAKSRISEDIYNLFGNNCEHFVVWCRKGDSIDVLKDYNKDRKKL